MEANRGHTGASARGLEPARDLGAIQWRPELRVREDEIFCVPKTVGVKVNVPPAQTDQLRLALSSEPRGKNQHPQHRA